ncbi:MAG: DUF2807 domain-containing protein [Candidatus Bipolaricaulota bacterium]
MDNETSRGRREERRVDPFERISLDAIGTVVVEQGEAFAVVVEAPDEILDDVVTMVDESTLHIDVRSRLRRARISAELLKVEVKLPRVRGLAIDGFGEISSGALHTDRLDVQIDGAGRIRLEAVEADQLSVGIDGRGALAVGSTQCLRCLVSVDGVGSADLRSVEAEKLDVKIDGRGRVEALGRAQRVAVEVDGQGSAELRDLQAREAHVRIDGVGKAVVWAEESLDVRIDGYGRVEYRGRPRIRERIDGTGRVVPVVATEQVGAACGETNPPATSM